MKRFAVEHETWLELSDAADYLGVHFTTLRRWADAGEIACIRTPGGRRRFSVKALEEFLGRSRGAVSGADTGNQQKEDSSALVVPEPSPTSHPSLPLQDRAIDHARHSVHSLSGEGSFLSRMTDEQRLYMKGTGHRLTALLLQYNSRLEGGEAFLDEGRRISREYSQVCRQVGLSVQETTRIFLFFRRSILDAIYETGYLSGHDDQEGRRLYARSSDFFDQLLVDLIGSYMIEQPYQPPESKEIESCS